MRSIKRTIEDFIAEFGYKSRSEKIHAIKIMIIQLIVVVGLICSPPIITWFHDVIEGQINNKRMPELSEDEKWNLVAVGRLHIECEPNVDETLRKLGFDPASMDAKNYAIHHGLCGFHMN